MRWHNLYMFYVVDPDKTVLSYRFKSCLCRRVVKEEYLVIILG